MYRHYGSWFDSHKTKINFIPLDEAVYTVRHLHTDTSNGTVLNFCLELEIRREVQFYFFLPNEIVNTRQVTLPTAQGGRKKNRELLDWDIEPVEMQRHLNLYNHIINNISFTNISISVLKDPMIVINDPLCLF